MKIGYFGFNNGPLGEPQAMQQILQTLEASGFESAWTGEHLVLIDPQRPPVPTDPITCRSLASLPAIALEFRRK